MTKLTDQQKLEKQKLDGFKRLSNRLKSEFSFKKIKTIKDLYTSIGREREFVDKLPDTLLTFPIVTEELNKLQDELEKEIRDSSQLAGDSSGQETQVDKSERGDKDGQSLSKELPDDSKLDEEAKGADENYGLEPSEKEKVKLFWFQAKATVELLKGLI